MNKDIEKNRKTLIRHFTMLGKTRGSCIMDCAKTHILDLFDLDHVHFAGSSGHVHPEIKENLDMSHDEWHSMERYYEDTVNKTGGRRTFADTADWLQTLPGWPTVL